MVKRYDRCAVASGIAIALVTVAIVAVLVLALALSNAPPGGSGPPDQDDGSGNATSPSNANVTLSPGQASAQVIVTLRSTHSIFSVHYVLYLNSDKQAEGDVHARSAAIQTITLVFPENQTGRFKAVVLVTSSGGGFGDKNDQAVITPVNGGTYPVTLKI